MQSKATTIKDYLAEVPAERQDAMEKLRQVILKNLPKGYEERICYGMICYVVPHKLYPAGYHCDPSLPLSLMCIASQKNFIAVYNMGIYTDKKLLDWFTEEYARQGTSKLDMGKSCMRFKKPDAIPFKLIGQLAGKLTVKAWVDMYEQVLKNSRKK